MKTIENPNGRKLAVLLIPAFLMLVVIPILKSIPVWTIVVSVISVVSYMAALTYYCIRQKCYRQLAVNYIVLFVWALVLIIQFWVVPNASSHA